MSDNHPQLRNDNHFQSTSGLSPPAINSIGICKMQTAGMSGEIQHVMYLAENIGSLYLSAVCSDVILKVEGYALPAHRLILAARSDYFRALLFNGMRETRDTEIELVDTSVDGFKMLLKYIYTGKLSLSSLKEEVVLDVLGLAHRYGFTELELSISEYLKAVLNIRNVCTIYGVAHLYSLHSLYDVCLNYADKHAVEVLSTQGFLHLSALAVEQMIRRDSLCAPEIEIFKAVREWVRLHASQVEDIELIVSKLRLPLMKLNDLLNVVRPSGLLSADAILDAIRDQQEKKSGELTYRGFLLHDINVLTTDFNTKVLTGEGANNLLNGELNRYDTDRGFTSHIISEKSSGIIIELGRPFIINHISLLLWDRDQRSYSYYIEVSMDSEDWIRVIDYRKYLCRSHQNLFFPARVVKFIRVVGTYNSVNNAFYLVNIEATYNTRPPDFDPATSVIIPLTNVASIVNNAVVIEGVSRSRNALINGDTSNYDWDNGYTCHQLGSGAIVVQLPQPYLINSMRLLLWDCDDRYYSYYVEVSSNQASWTRVADHTQDQCKAWQLLRFDYIPVVYIRIVGTNNSANEVFHCVHFECPAQRAALMALDSISERSESNTPENNNEDF